MENVQFVPSNGTRNVGTRSLLWIAAQVTPVPISFYVTMNNLRVVKWMKTQDNINLTQKTGLVCTGR
jgi:hypothetical protein